MATRTEKKRWAAPVPKPLVELKKSLKSPEDFEALPPHQRRLVIAADVVEWLDSKKIVAFRGRYITNGVAGTKSADRTVRKEVDARAFVLDRVQRLTPKGKKFCVCAMGAACIATVARANKLKLTGVPLTQLENIANLEDEGDGTEVGSTTYMEQYFPIAVLRQMEAAFERHPVYHDYEGSRHPFPLLYDEYYNQVTMYMPRLKSADSRLRSVFMNVIRNRGLFNPQDTV